MCWYEYWLVWESGEESDAESMWLCALLGGGGCWFGKLGTKKGVQLVYLAVSVMDMSRMNAELAARLKWFPSPSQ